MILTKKCPACEGINFVKKLTCIDHTTSGESFNIVSCETCDFTLTNPRPKDRDLAKYYESDMYISHTNSTKGFFNWLYQKVRTYSTWRKIRLLKSINKGGAHLDVGCGTGEFLMACEEAGFKTRGVEPSKAARDQAIKNYNLSVSENTDLSEYKSSEFDSISMWHVLEHMPNLNSALNEANRILKAKGKLVIAVPNHKSWDASYYKTHWAAWDVPIHLWHFSKTTLERLLRSHNFTLIKTKPMMFDSYYVSLLSEEFISGKKNYIKGFAIGFISNIFGILTKRGHSSITYVFEKK